LDSLVISWIADFGICVTRFEAKDLLLILTLPSIDIPHLIYKKKDLNSNKTLDYSRVDMRGAACEAVFIYCECAATKQIGLPEG